MLNLYRRHTASCREKLSKKFTEAGVEPAKMPSQISQWYKCKCPIWIVGTDTRGKFHRHTLNTNDDHIATERKRDIDRGTPLIATKPVADAIEHWLTVKRNNERVSAATISTLNQVARPFKEYCAANGLPQLSDVTTEVIDKFMATWKVAASTQGSQLKRLRQFFTFCMMRGWIPANPASKEAIKAPKARRSPTLPFTEAEEQALFNAALNFDPATAPRSKNGSMGFWRYKPRTGHALNLVMRATGLRIGDALRFDPDKIEPMTIVNADGTTETVHTYATHQGKTGEWVLCPIPDDVVAFLRSVPRASDDFLFLPAEFANYANVADDDQDGKDARVAFLTQQGNLFRRFLKVLGRMAGVENVRPHRWRDTFAIDLLVHDTRLEDVSDLLGHRDTKITLEYYRPWVKPLQQRLVRNVIATWKRR